MSARLLAPGLLTLLAAGCTCASSSSPGDARHRFTAQGEGPANQLPLNPLRVGSVMGEGTDTALIDGVVDTTSGRELRMTNVFSGLVTRVLNTAEGLFFTGSTTDGTAPRPILVVPATVRVGMAWEVLGDQDAVLYTYRVVERSEVADSWFGPGVVWRIDQTDAAGEVIGRRYLEGRGSVDAPPRVMWNQDPAVSAEPAPAVALAPLTVPDGFRHRGWVESLSLVRPSAGGPGLFLANDEAFENGGQIGWCGSWSGAADAPVLAVQPSAGAPFRRTRAADCVSTRYCATVTGGGGGAYLDCSLEYVSGHASGVLVGSDGQLTWAPRSNAGTLAYADLTRAGRDFSTTSYRALAVVPDAQGRVNVLYSHYAGYGDLLALGDADQLLGDPASPRLVPNNTLGLQDLQLVTPLSDDTGGRSTLLLQTADGMLWSATLSGTALSRPVRHVRLAGRLSVQATEHGNEVLRVTADGLVQRLRVDSGVLSLEPVARVTGTAPGEAVHSAFLWREGSEARLVVATTSYDGRDARGALLKLNLFRSTTPVSPGAAVRPSAVNGVRAVTAGPNQDVLVCWSGGGAPQLSGWTIGGAPALAVAALDQGGPCVQVFRPPGQADPGGLLGSRYFTVEGPIPGQGRVTVRTSPSPNLGLTPGTIPPVLAPLRGGGFVSGRRLLGAGGVTLGIPTLLLDGEPSAASCPPGAPCGVVVDAAGNGLWVNQADPIRTDVMSLRRLGLTSFALELPRGSGVERPAGGGGVLMGLYDAGVFLRYHLAPDGGMTPLPALPAQYTVMGRSADGTLCGEVAGEARTFCRRPDGGEVSRPMPADAPSLWPMLPGEEGVFLGLFTGGPGSHYGLDPATGEVFDHPGAHLDVLSYAFGADGSLWGIVVDTTPGLVEPVKAVRFRRSGPEPVAIPSGLLATGDRLARMVVDEQVILFVTQYQRMFTVARPP